MAEEYAPREGIFVQVPYRVQFYYSKIVIKKLNIVPC